MTGSAVKAAHAESASQAAGRRVRRWRGIVLPVLALVVIAVLLAALRPEGTGGYLDPESPADTGSRALAEITRQNGTPVIKIRTVREAQPLGAFGDSDDLLVIVRSERLTGGDLRRLSRASTDLLLVEPTDAALERLAPGVSRATTGEGEAGPACSLAEARAAGTVSFGASQVFTAPGGALSCYPAGDEKLPRLVRIPGPRTITVLGSGEPLVNGELREQGNAALGMNLLDGHPRVIWLMPDLPSEEEAGDRSLTELIPPGVSLFFWQLLVAAALLALWRMRRLGPVVIERLPVAVRSAETVEGRSRLYRAARARDRAALALRESARERLVPLLGLPRSAAADPARSQQIITLVTSRAGWDQQTAAWALYGPDPVDDTELVRLTDLLDDLEEKLR